MVKPDYLVLKIGGSLFSDKSGADQLDLAAMDRYAALIGRIAAEFPGRLVLVTGGGAHGHGAIRRNRSGGTFALAELTRALFVVKDVWAERLALAGVDALPLQLAAFSVLRAGRPETGSAVISGALAAGLLPILSGDCLLTSDGELAAFSSDRVPEALVDVLGGTMRAITYTDVPGILAGGPGGTVLRQVDALRPEEAHRELWPQSEWDSTGAMHSKLDALVACARAGAECFIMRGDPEIADAGLLLGPVSEWPDDWQYTRIARED